MSFKVILKMIDLLLKQLNSFISESEKKNKSLAVKVKQIESDIATRTNEINKASKMRNKISSILED